jgi:cytosine/adenosine deaminase-related metal-dependent hydrolase
VKTLITGGTVVTCDARDRVVLADVLLEGHSIVAVGKNLRPTDSVVRLVDARDCAVIPGFVQAHVHLCQTLMRGMADDMPLLEWLRRRIWPFEAAHDEASLRVSAELGLLEMSLAGTTTILDMGTVHHHDVVMDACDRSGMRAESGKTMMDAGGDVPRGLRETTKESLAESDRLRETWQGRSGRLGYAYAPRFILSCTERLVREVADRSRATGALMHSHAAEHPDERAAVRSLFGAEDVAVLRTWGFFGERAVLAHGVQLSDAEARRIARDQTRFVHCPSANLKLGSGIARVARLTELGVLFALGADGAPCNNNMDPWIELRHAALLAKTTTGVETLGARKAFRLATIDGARALGLDRRIGSIEVGKQADLAIVRLDGPHAIVGNDVLSKLVYACQARDVVHVFVDGEHVVRFGEHTRLDRERVTRIAHEQAARLVRRASTT